MQNFTHLKTLRKKCRPPAHYCVSFGQMIKQAQDILWTRSNAQITHENNDSIVIIQTVSIPVMQIMLINGWKCFWNYGIFFCSYVDFYNE